MSYIKIQANQATISESQNLLDFEVPSYMNGIDMNESFINLTYTITDTETDPASGIGIHNYIHLFNGIFDQSHGADGVLHNSCLVRRATLTSTKAGQLESIQRADLINEIKQLYGKNVADFEGEGHEQIANIPNQFNYGSDSSRNLVVEGDVTSSTRDGVMRVNLKDIFGLGESVLNLNQLGALRISLEANLNKFTLAEVPGLDSSGNVRITPESFNDAYAEYYTGLDPTAANNLSGGQLGDILNIPLDAFQSIYEAKKNMPFWVGQKVTFDVNYADASEGADVVETLITDIEYETVAAAGDSPTRTRLQLTFKDNMMDDVNAEVVTSIEVKPVHASTSTFTWKRAELVCKSVSNPQQTRGIAYRTFSTIQDFAAATTSLQRTYEIPRNGVASLVCFDTSTSGSDFSSSWDPNVQSYQIMVDNVGMTDRPVNIQIATPFIKDPLHSIMLEKALEEMGYAYKKNTDVLPAQTRNSTDGAAAIPSFDVFPVITEHNGLLTLPVIYQNDGTPKLMTMNVSKDTTGSNFNLVIFTQVERTIEY